MPINRVEIQDLFQQHDSLKIQGGDITDRKFGEEALVSTTHFTIKGKHDYIDQDQRPGLDDENSDRSMAKIIVVDDRSPKYQVRVGSTGRFYDPMGLDERDLHKANLKQGQPEYRFMDISKKCFDMYMEFLKTKNRAWLTNAEREAF